MSVNGSSGNWDSAIISELLWYWNKKLSMFAVGDDKMWLDFIYCVCPSDMDVS